MFKGRALALIAMVAVMSLMMTSPAFGYTVSQTWGTAAEPAGSLIMNTPCTVAKDSAGNVYVADMGNHRIVKMDQNGTVITKFGTLGASTGQFNTPFGVQIDNDGNILVADTLNYRIQKFDANFNFLSQWGTKGTGNGQFELVREMAIDSRNYYHVVDEFSHRIQVFDSDGVYQYQYGTKGTGSGQFVLPQGIAIKQSGAGDRVYVADTYNNRVQCLDRDGNWISTIGSLQHGDGNYSFYHPRGVGLDSSGNVFVVDTYNNKIKKYNSSHTFVYSCGLGFTYSEPMYPIQMVHLNNDYFMVTDSGNNRIIKYRDYGTSASVSSRIGTLRTENGRFAGCNSVSVDSSGNVYVTDWFNHRVVKHDANGNIVWKIGGNSGNGGTLAWGSYYWQFAYPHQVWVDKPTNRIFVADTGNSRIQVFSANGTWLTNFGYWPYMSIPTGVCVDSNGNIFVADTGNNRILKYNSSYLRVGSWGTEGLGDGEFRQPMYIACDSSNNVYVVDRINNRVQKFNNNGTFITKWGTNGGVPHEDPLYYEDTFQNNGNLFLPVGIMVDSSGNIIVADTSNNRMQKFNSNGTFLEKWGIWSGTSGNFFSPQGVGCGDNGSVFVADTLLNRVTKFIP